MRFLNSSINFKEADNGKVIFYPYGKLGSAYLISNDDGRKINKVLKLFKIILLIINLPSIIILKLNFLFLLIIEIILATIVVQYLLATIEKIKIE